jgi:hypothetical protein
MKRFHVHVAVDDLDANFYSKMFGVPPAVAKPDYAKWMLEDPRVNFTIFQARPQTRTRSSRGASRVNQELATLRALVAQVDIAALDQLGAQC